VALVSAGETSSRGCEVRGAIGPDTAPRDDQRQDSLVLPFGITVTYSEGRQAA